MGMLAKMGVAADSKKFFDAMMSPTNHVMDAVRDHPMMMRAVSIAFPPARGVLAAVEMANSVQDILNSDREKATDLWKKQSEGAQQAGTPLIEQLANVAKQAQQQHVALERPV